MHDLLSEPAPEALPEGAGFRHHPEAGLEVVGAPLQLQRSVLSSVSFEPSDVPSATIGEFRIVLRTGDVLFG